jgi:hypothetical protein
MTQYYGRDGRLISTREMSRLFGSDNQKRQIGRDDIDGVLISTVHLVLDHSFGQGPPLIFETMIFGGPHDQWQDRYSTEAEAKAGHARVVAALRERREP